ncbi:STAS domain-containing protein [Pseudonocardia sp.]|jgi:ABC-type transporter Mla MlaB component|uniref:STAS domain-containing protein n=1 Tax=Pseudonocardia sp. TaxID=60912 RepID=UPI0031FC7319
MTITSPLGRLTASASPPPAAPAIRSVQPDRDHGVLEVAGALCQDNAAELRQRVEGLLVAGVRYLLVDLAEADGCDPAVMGVLADAARLLEGRQGWLRINPNGTLPVAAKLDEATLPDLFAIYRASAGTSQPGGRHAR